MSFPANTHVLIPKAPLKTGEGKKVLDLLNDVSTHVVKNEPFTSCYYFGYDAANPDSVWGIEVYENKDALESKHMVSPPFLKFAGYLSSEQSPMVEPIQLLNFEVVDGFLNKNGAPESLDDYLVYTEYQASGNPDELKEQLTVDQEADTSIILHSLDDSLLFATVTRYANGRKQPEPAQVPGAAATVQHVKYAGVGFLTHN
ncbi:antibiotic biosynthesis monooxygenase-like domain [Schizosaccharomyces osmophilus]|uniref:Antibiotic biosynthesis monooxygenase-like domain n=1 Tax=Schizosaccharomyces osmophilus TaxID=2545709 RepID=A0AAF0AUL1_9SCHI|nr:antibiotic biosynthesis monooxygenase-like domain [Schizosaccharomyces osmophilus]WBW70984.1 antibiotic biosynthesis monooxygenase-like domain [Schizosaccharomyces osmophilus]